MYRKPSWLPRPCVKHGTNGASAGGWRRRGFAGAIAAVLLMGQGCAMIDKLALWTVGKDRADEIISEAQSENTLDENHRVGEADDPHVAP